MGKLATSKYIYDTFSLGTSSSRFPTKSEIVNLGLTVSGSYANNLLVCEEDLSIGSITLRYITFLFSFSDVLYFDLHLYDHVELNYNGTTQLYVTTNNYQKAYIISYVIKNSTIEVLDRIAFDFTTANKNNNVYTFSSNITVDTARDTYLAIGDYYGNIYEPDNLHDFLSIELPETNNAWHYTIPKSLDLYVKLYNNNGYYYFGKVTNSTTLVKFNTESFQTKEVYVKMYLDTTLDAYAQYQHTNTSAITGLSSYIIGYNIVNTEDRITVSTDSISTYFDYMEDDDGAYLLFMVLLDVNLVKHTYFMFEPNSSDIYINAVGSDGTSISLKISKYSLEGFDCIYDTLPEEIDDTIPDLNMSLYPEEVYIS